MNIFQVIGVVIFVLLFSAGISFGINQNSIQLIRSQYKVISSDNLESSFENIDYGDIIELEGTIDYLKMVSDEPADISATTYFAGLKEFGNKFIIRFSADKLNSAKTKFVGKAIKVNSDSFSKVLLEKLNAPLSFDDINNLTDQLDIQAKEKIIEQSTADFNENTILILDGMLINDSDIYLNFIITLIVVFILILTLFRKKIFTLKRKQIVDNLVQPSV